MYNQEKVSVIVATYNGSKFLEEQLSSIFNQTVSADEVIIRDDVSTDNTFEIIQDFIARNKLSHWKAVRGEKNIGWMKNFRELLDLATGDIIFLADQDDIWLENKAEIMLGILGQNPDIELLASGYHYLINGEIVSVPQSKKPLRQDVFQKRFFHTTLPGACYAIRRSLLNAATPIWNDTLPHDAQLWVLSLIRNTRYVYDRPLMLYRRHENTATGRDELSSKVKLRNIRFERDLIQQIKQYGKTYPLDPSKKMCIDKAERYVENRHHLICNRKPLAFLRALLYAGYYIKKKTLLGDFYVSLFNR